MILVEAGGGLTCNELSLNLSWQPPGYPQEILLRSLGTSMCGKSEIVSQPLMK